MRKIGWQKYEELIEEQMNSPFLQNFVHDIEDEGFDTVERYEDESPQKLTYVDSNIVEAIALSSNFDCWIGHSNFDISKNVALKINDVEGVELLKVCGRYRFLVGVGKMFDFKNVRKNIEDKLIGLQ